LNVLVDNVLVAAVFTQEVIIRTIDVKKVFFTFFKFLSRFNVFTSFAEDERFLNYVLNVFNVFAFVNVLKFKKVSSTFLPLNDADSLLTVPA